MTQSQNEILISHEFSKRVIELIDTAKVSLNIVAFDWRWYVDNPSNPMQQVNLAILRAIARGVRVRALLNHRSNLREFNTLGIKAKCLRHKKPLHAKMIMIDDKIVVSGSHNMTRSALALNYEISYVLFDADLIERALLFFNRLYDF